MHVTLHRGDEHLAGLFVIIGAACLNMRLQDGHGLLHSARRLHHLRQEHLAATEELAHGVHSVHQRSLYDIHRLGIYGESLGKVFFQMVSYSLHEGILQAFVKRFQPPLLLLARSHIHIRGSILTCLYLLGKGY